MFVTGGATGAAKLAKLSKVGAKAAPILEKTAQVGTAIDPLNLATNTALYGATKAIPTTVAPKLYESAAKWSTKLSPEERKIKLKAFNESKIGNKHALGKTWKLSDESKKNVANSKSQEWIITFPNGTKKKIKKSF